MSVVLHINTRLMSIPTHTKTPGGQMARSGGIGTAACAQTMNGVMDMFISAVVTVLVTALGVFLGAYFSVRQARKDRLERAEDLATRFREPLLQAANNLQSRLYNIARQDFLGRFLTAPEASEQEREYA